MRGARITADGCYHHVMNRGRARQTTFSSEADFLLFESLLARATKRFSTKLHAYCLMSNHFHLLLENIGGDMHKFMHWVVYQYVQVFNQKYNIDGALFKDRYKSTVVDSTEYLKHLIAYIHANPLAFLTHEELKGYPYSSLPTYLGSDAKLWLTTDLVNSLKIEHGSANSSHGKYYQYDKAVLLADLAAHLQSGVPDVLINETLAKAAISVERIDLFIFDGLSRKSKMDRRRRAKAHLEFVADAEQRRLILETTRQWLNASVWPVPNDALLGE